MSNDANSSTITCSSTHLTSFAVLVDVSDGHQVATTILDIYVANSLLKYAVVATSFAVCIYLMVLVL